MNATWAVALGLIEQVKQIAARFTEHRTSLIAGGLAYFVALAVAPAAIVIGGIAGMIIGPDNLQTLMDDVFSRSPLPAQALRPVTDAIVSASGDASAGAITVASIISLGVAVYAASKVVYGLRMAMDTAFEVSPKYRGMLGRVTATLITLLGILATVAGIVLLTVVPHVLSFLGVSGPHLLTGPGVIDWLLAAVLLWLGVRWTMRRAPNRDQRIPFLSLGAIGSTLWILAASAGVGIYVNYSSTLGAAIALFGAPIVLLLWFYLCFLGLLYGAEVEATNSRKSNSALN
ncbi:MAG: YhjD/YihY/BrkB family envelope integrity protein [Actinomycetes bacterium]